MRISDWSSDGCSSYLAVIAAGVESMTRVPMGSTGALFAQAGLGTAKSPRQEARYPGIHFSQFTGAERIAAKYGFSRDDLARFAPESHHRAAAATTRGDFADEIVPLPIQIPESQQQPKIDQGIDSDETIERTGRVNVTKEDRVIQTANATQHY